MVQEIAFKLQTEDSETVIQALKTNLVNSTKKASGKLSMNY